MSAIDLEPDEARYLAVLAAQDIRSDEERGLSGVAARHRAAWEKIQPACRWDDDEGGTPA